MKAFKLTAALAALLLLLCSCTNSIKYDSSTRQYVDQSTGAAYTDAPMCYEARVMGDKYAVWKNEIASVDFYTVKDADPLLWLVEEGGTVFYSDRVTLPTLREMNVNEVMVCVDYSTKQYVLAEIFDAEHIDAIIEAWETGESVEYPATAPNVNYRVKFASESYPFLYYSLIYLEYSDGAYLYCRDTDRCVPAGDIIRGYLDGTLE